MDDDIIISRVKDAYKDVFYDLLESRISCDEPDYDWLVYLYNEIKHKMTVLLRPGIPLRIEIEEAMDSDLFEQMLRNNAFESFDLYKLVQFVFAKCRQLQSPARDEATLAKLKEINDMFMDPTSTFAKIIPLFIRNINDCLDTIYDDLHEFIINNE